MNQGCVVVAIFIGGVISVHMADALVSPAVGGALWAAGAVLSCYSAKNISPEFHAQKAPLMGVMGAFVFAAQMINFAIPGTGSSGHLGGGILLSVMLGPYAGFLTMASILTIQALLFADGGLLALGCNIINLAFFPCFIAYPLIYKKAAGDSPSSLRMGLGVILAVVAGLQMGAMGVVFETTASGISELPFQTFVRFMLPIHLVIGLVEALVTTAVLRYVWQESPDLLFHRPGSRIPEPRSMKRTLVMLLLGALLTAGMLSWVASPNPDGLEWAIEKTAGREDVANSSAFHTLAASWQAKIALFPDYQIESSGSGGGEKAVRQESDEWPTVRKGTSVAGLIGSALTLVVAGAVGAGCRMYAKRSAP